MIVTETPVSTIRDPNHIKELPTGRSNPVTNIREPFHYADYQMMKYILARKPYLEEYCGWKQSTNESDGRINIE